MDKKFAIYLVPYLSQTNKAPTLQPTTQDNRSERTQRAQDTTPTSIQNPKTNTNTEEEYPKAIIEQIKQFEQDNPLPVQSQPNPLAYSVQGIVLLLTWKLGEPLFELFKSILSDKAKEKKVKEEQALDAQINFAKYVQEQSQFLQKLVTEQQSENIKELTKILEGIRTEFRSIDESVRSQKDSLLQMLELLQQTVEAQGTVNVKIKEDVPVIVKDKKDKGDEEA